MLWSLGAQLFVHLERAATEAQLAQLAGAAGWAGGTGGTVPAELAELAQLAELAERSDPVQLAQLAQVVLLAKHAELAQPAQLAQLSLHNMMLPHGPDADAFEKASNSKLEPVKITNTLAFMFETKYPQHLTEFASQASQLQGDYIDCWQDIRKNFDGKK